MARYLACLIRYRLSYRSSRVPADCLNRSQPLPATIPLSCRPPAWASPCSEILCSVFGYFDAYFFVNSIIVCHLAFFILLFSGLGDAGCIPTRVHAVRDRAACTLLPLGRISSIHGHRGHQIGCGDIYSNHGKRWRHHFFFFCFIDILFPFAWLPSCHICSDKEDYGV